MSFFKKHSGENMMPEEQLEIIDEKKRLEMQEEMKKEFETAGIKIEQPRQFLDLPINFEFFGEEYGAQLKIDCNALWSYLKLPLVWDNFGNNHRERQEWRKSMKKRYGKMFPEETNQLIDNKLCGNKTQAVIFAIGRIREELEKLGNKQYEYLIKTVTTAENDIYDISLKYPNKDTDEKKSEITKTEDRVYATLKAISEFSKK